MDVDMDVDVLIPAGADISPEEREQRRTAIKRFMERKKVVQLTEQLRARLSYASYKATHGYANLPLSTLDPIIDQQLAARTPSPSQSSITAATSRRRSRARAQSFSSQRVPTSLSALSATPSPNLDALGQSTPGSLYAALFGTPHPIAGMPASLLPKSPSAPPPGFPFTNGRKRALNFAGSVPPPESPRKHRRTTGSASFSHPPRHAQEEAANAAAILAGFLQSSQDSSQSTKVGSSQSQTQTYVGSSQSSQQSSISRTSSSSSAAPSTTATNPRQATSSRNHKSYPISNGLRTPPRGPSNDQDAADTLLYLATSPSPARGPSSSSRPSASSSSATAPSGPARVLFPPTTPHGFSFSDYVNVSPSPAGMTGPFRGGGGSGGAGGDADGRGLAGLQPPPGIF